MEFPQDLHAVLKAGKALLEHRVKVGQGWNSRMEQFRMFSPAVGLQCPLCPCGRQPGTERGTESTRPAQQALSVWREKCGKQSLNPAWRCFRPERLFGRQICLVWLGWKCTFFPLQKTNFGGGECEAASVTRGCLTCLVCCLHRGQFPFSGSWSHHGIVEWFGLEGP